MRKIDLENKNLVLSTHAYLADGKFNTKSGPTKPLLDCFASRVNYFFLIGQPPPYIKSSLTPFLFVYQRGILKEKIYSKFLSALFHIPLRKRRDKTFVKSKIRDFISVLYFAPVIKKYIKDDSIWLYIGVDAVNTFAGIWLRKYLRIKNIIFYIFDWSVRWFKNSFLNALHIWLDRYVCYNSDFIWNISSRIEEARREILKYDDKKTGKQFTLLYGMPFRDDLAKEQIDDILDTIIYVGYLNYDNGTDILPDIAREIEKIDATLKVIIIGGGDDYKKIKDKIIKYKLYNIELKGNISDQNLIDNLLAKSHVAIAPYNDIPHSRKKYGDVIKIRNYFACGLPVVSTSVPPVSKEIIDEKLGFVVPYDAREFAQSCVKLLKDRELYRRIRSNVIAKAKNHSWNNIFNGTLESMFKQV